MFDLDLSSWTPGLQVPVTFLFVRLPIPNGPDVSFLVTPICGSFWKKKHLKTLAFLCPSSVGPLATHDVLPFSLRAAPRGTAVHRVATRGEVSAGG